MIKSVVKRKRKDPLTDIDTLNQIGKSATKKARTRAFANQGYIVICNTQGVFRLYPDGLLEKIKSSKNYEFPPLEKDLGLQ